MNLTNDADASTKKIIVFKNSTELYFLELLIHISYFLLWQFWKIWCNQFFNIFVLYMAE